MKRVITNIICFSFFTSSYIFADVFEATRQSIIHKEAKSASTEIGRVLVGETVLITNTPSVNSWINIKKGNVIGWVYKKRGVIHKTETSSADFELIDQTMNFWFGNLQAHTGEDNGEPIISDSTHEQAFAYAMDNSKGNLDFLAVTPHTHLVKSGTYEKLLNTVNDSKFYVPGKFVPIAGQEFSSTSSGNHINIFNLDAWIAKDKIKNPKINGRTVIKEDDDIDTVENGNYRDLYESFIPRHKTDLTFGQFNHPKTVRFTGQKGKEYGRDDYDSNMQEWIEASDRYIQLIEIVAAPSHKNTHSNPHFNEISKRVKSWLWALSQGWHLAPAANQDNHYVNWGDGSDSRVVAIAPNLTKIDISKAFQKRRSYATEDSTMEVTFKASEAWMGSVIFESEFNGFSVMVNDQEEPNAKYNIELFKGSIGGDPIQLDKPFRKQDNVNNEVKVNFDNFDVAEKEFYFVRIKQDNNADDPNQNLDGDDAWTSPIWIEEPEH